MSDQSGAETRRKIGALASAFAIIFLAVYGPLAFAKHADAIAPLWPANAIAVVMLLRAPRAGGLRWDLKIAIALALLVGNLAAGTSPFTAACFTLSNCIEIAATLWLLRGGDLLRRLNPTAGDLTVVVVAAAGVLGPAIGATAALVTLSSLLHEPPAKLWMDWFLPAALSMSIVVPTGLLIRVPNLSRVDFKRNAIDLLVCVALPALVAILTLSNPAKPLLFAVTPTIILAAVRLRALGVALAIIAIAVVATPIVGGAGGGIALAAYATPHDRLMVMQLFLLVQSVLGLVVAKLLDARDNLLGALKGEHARALEDGKQKLRLLTSVSHEIRTPLNVIQGMSEILSRRASVTAEDRELIDAVLGASNQLQTLAQDLLESARAEQGALHLSSAWIEAEGIVRSAVSEAQLSIAGQNSAVAVHMAPGLKVWADPLRFRQIVSNLVSNALKYGGDYGPISVAVFHDRGSARVEVRDCGPGFHAGARQTAFEPFADHAPRLSHRRGAGVGLSLVKQLAEAHGGAAGLTSTSHVETCVWVTLPLKDSLNATTPAQMPKEDVSELDPASVFGPM